IEALGLHNLDGALHRQPRVMPRILGTLPINAGQPPVVADLTGHLLGGGQFGGSQRLDRSFLAGIGGVDGAGRGVDYGPARQASPERHAVVVAGVKGSGRSIDGDRRPDIVTRVVIPRDREFASGITSRLEGAVLITRKTTLSSFQEGQNRI